MYSITETHELPTDVTIEALPGGGTWVILHRNAEQVEQPGEGGAPAGMIYRAEEVSFILPEGRTETVDTIRTGFNDWWLYGENWTYSADDAPTIEERVASVEAYVASILGGAL